MYNPITLVGAVISAISFGLILFLIILEALSPDQKPYMGVIAFVVLPAFLILGILLIAIGIIREHRRRKSGFTRELALPIVNLNDSRTRTAVTLFSTGTIVLLLFTAFGSYKAYEYTDSDQFCGTICHQVMTPEYTAYQYSPHARVGCVKCHIGPGADWFVRSKLSGTYQVYSVMFNLYPRPIPTPIENLRPAKETCEQCHWPKVFYGEKELSKTYFVSDKQNTRMDLTLLMKIGGGNEETGVTSGIHWHMNIANKISYLPLDRERQIIPWIKVTSNKNGKVTIFKSTEVKVTDAELKNAKYRTMDCMDCHNRPAHIFNPPAKSVNNVMAIGWIDPNIPYMKSISVQALDQPYSSKEVALDSIKIFIQEFYENNYPQIAVQKRDSIDSAIAQVQKIYERNYFPSMNANWRRFPEDIGHMYSPGCFRCHDGKHVSADGKVIPKDCTSCHSIIYQKYQNQKPQESLSGVDYRHPVDIGGAWKTMLCSDCHTRQK